MEKTPAYLFVVNDNDLNQCYPHILVFFFDTIVEVVKGISLDWVISYNWYQKVWVKTFRKIETANAIFWIYLGGTV